MVDFCSYVVRLFGEKHDEFWTDDVFGVEFPWVDVYDVFQCYDVMYDDCYVFWIEPVEIGYIILMKN